MGKKRKPFFARLAVSLLILVPIILNCGQPAGNVDGSGTGTGTAAGTATGASTGTATGTSTGTGTGTSTGTSGGASGSGGGGGGQAVGGNCPTPPSASMTFFVSSRTGTGNLGGLAGADAICQTLATDAGVGSKTWRAYLSTETPTVHAKDRIGAGPWYNYNGVNIGDLASLHFPVPNPDPTAFPGVGIAATETFTECGSRDFTYAVSGGTDHDILTGTQADGTMAAGLTCADWTSDQPTDNVLNGHSDWNGLSSGGTWNDADHTTSGCDVWGLASTAGKGRIYCFAIN